MAAKKKVAKKHKKEPDPIPDPVHESAHMVKKRAQDNLDALKAETGELQKAMNQNNQAVIDKLAAGKVSLKIKR